MKGSDLPLKWEKEGARLCASSKSGKTSYLEIVLLKPKQRY